MRVFNDFDKAFINKILTLEVAVEYILMPHTFFRDLLKIKSEVYITGRAANYELKEGESHYHKIEIIGPPDAPEDYFGLTSVLYQANDLFDYLLENGFLLRHEGAPALAITFNSLSESERPGTRRIEVRLTKPLKDILEKLAFHYIPTEALRDLAKHKFRTRDERASSKTRKISIASVIVACGSMIIAFFSFRRNNEPAVQRLFLDTTLTRTIENLDRGAVKLDTNLINFYIKKTKPVKKHLITPKPHSGQN